MGQPGFLGRVLKQPFFLFSLDISSSVNPLTATVLSSVPFLCWDKGAAREAQLPVVSQAPPSTLCHETSALMLLVGTSPLTPQLCCFLRSKGSQRAKSKRDRSWRKAALHPYSNVLAMPQLAEKHHPGTGPRGNAPPRRDGHHLQALTCLLRRAGSVWSPSPAAAPRRCCSAGGRCRVPGRCPADMGGKASGAALSGGQTPPACPQGRDSPGLPAGHTSPSCCPSALACWQSACPAPRGGRRGSPGGHRCQGRGSSPAGEMGWPWATSARGTVPSRRRRCPQ